MRGGRHGHGRSNRATAGGWTRQMGAAQTSVSPLARALPADQAVCL